MKSTLRALGMGDMKNNSFVLSKGLGGVWRWLRALQAFGACAALMLAQIMLINASRAENVVTMASFRSAGFFSVKIPTALHVSEDLGSAVDFMSSDKVTKADVEYLSGQSAGSIIFAEEDAKGNANAGYSPCASLPPAYKLWKGDVVAFSCIGKNGKIVYEYEKFGHGRQLLLHIEYPVAQRKYWDEAVKQMVVSLSFE